MAEAQAFSHVLLTETRAGEIVPPPKPKAKPKADDAREKRGKGNGQKPSQIPSEAEGQCPISACDRAWNIKSKTTNAKAPLRVVVFFPMLIHHKGSGKATWI